MGTTANRALRYPASTAAPNVPADMQNLANDVDAALGDDTGWLSTGGLVVPVTPTGAPSGSGLATLSSYGIRRAGGSVGIYASFTTGAAIANGTDGNLTNTPLLQVAAGYVPSVAQGGLVTFGTGPQCTYFIDATGLIYIVATDSGVGSSMVSGSSRSLAGSYFL